MTNKKILLIISIISILCFIIVFYFNLVDAFQTNSQNQTQGFMRPGPRMPIPFEYRIGLSPLLLLIAVIPVSYYFISQRLERKLEKNMKLMLKMSGKSSIKTKNMNGTMNKDAVLKLLNFNERKVLERLIKRNGEVLQSEISRIEGMNKLKTHRAIKNLEMKGVIETESRGKTKLVILTKEIRDIMLK
ncbi:MAG: winged helix-turn-helix transcriptional regulator [Candidatus Aenigmarchaeota archaeon]|nr:winged helix-turn-helix transcriptional regulator [Candidatus Aenigmarchaeota archaeon]